ncbi:MAG: HAD family phosphatase [Pseudomonadota bacterium]|nr:HAD family phosphatase [Pseudomonadota bacterium]
MNAVIFDIGNVLIRWRPEAALAPLFASPSDLEEALQRAGFSAWNREQDRGRSWEDGIAAAATPQDARLFRAYYQGLAAAHAETIPQTVALLEQLAGRAVPLYALTNASVETARIVARTHGFMARFRDVCISGAEALLKPDPEIYRRLLARNALEAGDCLFVDDSAANVAGAQAVGMKAHHYTGADGLRERLQHEGLL